MNLTDLSEVLRDRAELAGSSHDARMEGVRARVSATRRRRAVTGVACVVLVLVGIVYATLPRPQAPPEPAVPPRSLPEYQQGTKLIGQAWGDLPSTTITVHFVPKSLDLWIFTQCDAGQGKTLSISTAVNGHAIANHNTCGGGSRPTDWTGLLEPGRPAVLTMTVDGEQAFEGNSPKPLPVPANGTFAIGVGEVVPVEEYPFPPRPETLQPFPDYPVPDVELRSDPSDPLARKELTVDWPGNSLVMAQMNTPGRMRVLVDDVLVIELSNWSYTLAGAEARDATDSQPAEGQRVKITVIPERITGEWRMGVVRRGR